MRKVFIPSVLVIASFAITASAYAYNVTIDPVNVESCGTHQVTLKGTADLTNDFHPADGTLVVSKNGVPILNSTTQGSWSVRTTVSPGVYAFDARISSRNPDISNASDVSVAANTFLKVDACEVASSVAAPVAEQASVRTLDRAVIEQLIAFFQALLKL